MTPLLFLRLSKSRYVAPMIANSDTYDAYPLSFSKGTLQKADHYADVRSSSIGLTGHGIEVPRLSPGCQNGSIMGVGVWNL